MAQWGNTDDAANSVIWATAQVKKTVNTSNQTALFNNTEPDDFIDGIAIGQFGVDVDETTVIRATGAPKPAHAGWNLRTEGTGGRAGRISYETLVAMSTITGDASDDDVLPDFTLSIDTQPSNQSANIALDEEATFTVVASSIPAGANIEYEWEYTAEVGNTDSFVSADGEAGFADALTDELVVSANTVESGTLVRVIVSTDGAEDIVSDSAEFTVTGYVLSIDTQPTNQTANSSADEEAYFNVVALSNPAGANIEYEWEYTTEVGNTDSFETTIGVAGFDGQETDELTVFANTIADGTSVRVIVSAEDAITIVSDDATLTVTS
jgi:hypothetical protein